MKKFLHDFIDEIFQKNRPDLALKVHIWKMQRVFFIKLSSFDVLLGTTYSQSLSFQAFLFEENYFLKVGVLGKKHILG